MEYTTLGATGATVSRIGFGGAVLGLRNYLGAFDPDDESDRRQAEAAIDAALESGINYYDTAPGYGGGTSEGILGAALRGVGTSGGHPLFIATKVGWPDRHDVRSSLEASLHRLGRDHVDLVQVHGGSFTAAQTAEILGPNGMAQQLADCQQDGLVRHVGFTSEDNNEAVYRLIRSGRFDTVQLCYNLLFQHPYEPSRPFGSFIEAERHDLGILTMRTTTSGTFQRWIRMVDPGNTTDYSAALIQFVLSNPLVDVALVGMRTPGIVRANAAIADDAAGRIDLGRLHERYV